MLSTPQDFCCYCLLRILLDMLELKKLRMEMKILNSLSPSKIKRKRSGRLKCTRNCCICLYRLCYLIFFLLFVTSYYESRSLLLFMQRKNTSLCRLFELDDAGLAKHFEYFSAYSPISLKLHVRHSESEFQDS